MGEALRLHGLGAVVEVSCTGSAAAELAAAMRKAWVRCLEPANGHDPEAAGVPLEVRLDDPDRLATCLMGTTQDVTRALIGARSGALLMFHAGAVCDPRSGRSLAFVARGGTGKTTLTRSMGRRLGYLSDETVGVDDAGVVHPYPKPLSVRRIAQPDVKDELSPDDLDLLPAPARPHLSKVVLLDRDPEMHGAHLEELTFLDALFGLVEQSSALASLPRPLHRLADTIDHVGPVVRARYREAADIEDHLLGLLAERP